MRTRDGERHTPGAAEKIIRTVVQRTLYRVAARFAPHQEQEAAAAMTDELWNDTVLKATLAASNLELLRPAVQVHAGRRVLSSSAPRLALTDAQVAEPSASDAQQASFQSNDASHEEPSLLAGASRTDTAPQRQSTVEVNDRKHSIWNWNDISNNVSVVSNTSSSSPIWEDERNDAHAADDDDATWRTSATETVTPGHNNGLPAGDQPVDALAPAFYREAVKAATRCRVGSTGKRRLSRSVRRRRSRRRSDQFLISCSTNARSMKSLRAGSNCCAHRRHGCSATLGAYFPIALSACRQRRTHSSGG